jgi:hypothetical protein
MRFHPSDEGVAAFVDLEEAIVVGFDPHNHALAIVPPLEPGAWRYLDHTVSVVAATAGHKFTCTYQTASAPPPPPPPTGCNPAALSCVTDPTGLVYWAPLDGNANDVSGNNNTGTLVGTPTFAAGKIQQAVTLNGGQDIQVASGAPWNSYGLAPSLNTPFTITCMGEPDIRYRLGYVHPQ